MSDALQADLRAAIDKNLSAETAGVLRKRLDSIDGLEQRVAALTVERDAAVKHRDGANETVKAHAVRIAELEKVVADFKTRDMFYRESERTVLVANMQRKMADNRRQDVMHVVGLVFANTLVKRSIFTSSNETTPIVPPGSSYSQGSVTSTRNDTQTVTEEG